MVREEVGSGRCMVELKDPSYRLYEPRKGQSLVAGSLDLAQRAFLTTEIV